MKRLRISAALLLIALLIVVIGAITLQVTANGIYQDPLNLHEVDYIQSATCQSCHPSHYATWHDTYHRTMTQEASEMAVVGDFDNASNTFQGVTSRFYKEDEMFLIATRGFDGLMTEYEVVMTIGSRRIQQYVYEATDGSHWRIPMAWNIEEQRWFNLNAGFLHPDESDFNTHLSIWDANCIFCHNTQAMPGYDWNQNTFDASVAEMGIACESCHGPAQQHVRVNSNPLRRYWLYLTDPEQLRDPTLITPTELSQTQSVQVCGHCHGQRIPDPPSGIREMMAVGDPYRVGDDLADHYAPIKIDSELQGVDLTKRFWKDGTPRLTAYEYQGWQMSAHEETGLTCISCHNMHGGDSKGMIDEEMRGNLGCTQCHEEIAQDVSAHTQHELDSSGSDCYSCHMPKTSYGVLEIHPSHRITSPDPSRAWTYEMPEACTMCHTDQSVLWAAQETEKLFGIEAGKLPDDEVWKSAENTRALLMGDVVQRSVAAMAFSEVGTYTSDPNGRLWAAPFLILTMERDEYPAIRHFAYRSLRTLASDAGHDLSTLPEFDWTGTPTARQTTIDSYWQWWNNLDKSTLKFPNSAVPLNPDFTLNMQVVEPLLAQRNNELVTIGE